MLSRLVITFLPRSKRLLISWLQSPSVVILEPRKIKSDTVSTVSLSISHEVMGLDAMILAFWMLSLVLLYWLEQHVARGPWLGPDLRGSVTKLLPTEGTLPHLFAFLFEKITAKDAKFKHLVWKLSAGLWIRVCWGGGQGIVQAAKHHPEAEVSECSRSA